MKLTKLLLTFLSQSYVRKLLLDLATRLAEKTKTPLDDELVAAVKKIVDAVEKDEVK